MYCIIMLLIIIIFTILALIFKWDELIFNHYGWDLNLGECCMNMLLTFLMICVFGLLWPVATVILICLIIRVRDDKEKINQFKSLIGLKRKEYDNYE